jgi:hypothetical protein
MTTNKTILIAIVTLFLNYSAISQNCNLAIKDGSKLTLTAYSWTNPGLYDPKFQKLKEDKKDEQILAFNQSVSAGKVTPSGTYPMAYSVMKAPSKDGGDQYTLTTTIAGKEYSSYAFCKNDTILLYRNLGSVELSDGKGGSLGFTIQGAQILPLKINVGDKLPTYDDVSVLYPTTLDKTLKRTVIDQTSHTVYGDPMASSVQYKLRQIDVKVKETFNFSSHTVHYKNAMVTGEEEVNIGGIKYKAYIINSETWTKPTLSVSYETADEAVKKSEKKANEIIQESFTKTPKKQSTNELGYMVSYLKEWFVPEIGGIVKSESYDAFGSISGSLSLTSIE